MQLIAGFDAGQTHTTCRLALVDSNGTIQPLGEGQGSGVSHLAAAAGEARFQSALSSSLAAARTTAPAAWADAPLATSAVGASGMEAGSAVQARGLELASVALGLPAGAVAVTGDEHTALRGAFPQGEGILLISGTGCICLGQNAQGAQHRCGGWGWLLDGAGSAMDIGRDGLALSVQMADGRLPETVLRAALWSALGADTAQQVKARVVEPDFGAAGFARLAPVLDQLAAAGDPHSQAVLQHSAAALAGLVQGVAKHLTMDQPAVCGVGGALRHLVQLRSRFAAALNQVLPGATRVEPQGDATHGALLLAADLRLR